MKLHLPNSGEQVVLGAILVSVVRQVLVRLLAVEKQYLCGQAEEVDDSFADQSYLLDTAEPDPDAISLPQFLQVEVLVLVYWRSRFGTGTAVPPILPCEVLSRLVERRRRGN